MLSGDKHKEMSGKQENIGPNKNCRQKFPQIFQVRLNHHECQAIQELDEQDEIIKTSASMKLKRRP